MKTIGRLGLALFAATAFVMSSQAVAQEKLTVWWVKGFYKSEDDALYAAIKKYEDKSGVKVELSQYAVQDGIPKVVSALDAGTPPDVSYIDVFDFQVTGKWAYDGKLEDLSDILVPMKDKFLKNTLETTYLYNDKTKKKALRDLGDAEMNAKCDAVIAAGGDTFPNMARDAIARKAAEAKAHAEALAVAMTALNAAEINVAELLANPAKS